MPLLCIAHRGASAEFPENTLPAFARALELGADGIEFDLHLSFDGVLVVIHDETLARTTSGQGRVAEHTAAQLAELGVPTLEQVLDLAEGRCLLNLELKGVGTGGALAKWATARRAAVHSPRNWLVSSFNRKELEDFKAGEGMAPLGWLCRRLNAVEIATARQLGAWSVHPGWRGLTSHEVEEARKSGFNVIPYTLDTPEQWQRASDWGCDGVFSNRVEPLLTWRADRS
ncbi:MAG: hypothetical protein AUJ55_01250 [Proteobacteria bacterium CG1_02_64_396]|nr:MAG: hypothetical protein AUJ55_01250 [Proteobacteria bacterium CG1_02_64_396]